MAIGVGVCSLSWERRARPKQKLWKRKAMSSASLLLKQKEGGGRGAGEEEVM